MGLARIRAFTTPASAEPSAKRPTHRRPTAAAGLDRYRRHRAIWSTTPPNLVALVQSDLADLATDDDPLRLWLRRRPRSPNSTRRNVDLQAIAEAGGR